MLSEPFHVTPDLVIAWLERLFNAIVGAVQGRFLDMIAPIFICAVVFILVLERRYPAKPNQKIFSVSLFQDVVWAFIQGIGEATVIVAWMAILRGFYDRYLDFLTVGPAVELPSWLSVALAIVFMDFLRWLQHRRRQRRKKPAIKACRLEQRA